MLAYDKLWDMLGTLLVVVCRRDGNPFSLTRLLRVPDLLADLFERSASTASTALSFLAFGMEQFDNPPFTDDAVQALLPWLRHKDHGPRMLLRQPCAVPMLEALATAARLTSGGGERLARRWLGEHEQATGQCPCVRPRPQCCADQAS